MILEDPTLIDEIVSLVRHNLGAENAVDLTMRVWHHTFSHPAADGARARGDVVDVHIRLLTCCSAPDHDPVTCRAATGRCSSRTT
jgi:phosphoenolpyruvate-protein kinase (PTS system EI component)